MQRTKCEEEDTSHGKRDCPEDLEYGAKDGERRARPAEMGLGVGADVGYGNGVLEVHEDIWVCGGAGEFDF